MPLFQVSSSSRCIAPIQPYNSIHTTFVKKDETTPEGALMMAAQGMRVVPTRAQSAKEMLYGFVQVCKNRI